MYSFGLISPILSHLYLDSKAGIAQSAERLGNGFGGWGFESSENPKIFIYSKTSPRPTQLAIQKYGSSYRGLMGLRVVLTIDLI
jgi:hypothetical protein